jgi:tRNA-uridine 2-sulfurtransferase
VGLPASRIAVAVSGGMDSTAAALLLKRSGFEVAGLHMRLSSASEQSWNEAARIADEIGIPLHLIDLSQEFSDQVIKPFVAEYAAGRTPSPCPRCNRLIKTTLLMERAQQLGFDRLATGHYARIEEIAGESRLLKARDLRKDQSYFLSMVRRDALKRLALPLGIWTKQQVREFLRREGISAWRAEESQELCFISGKDYRSFLLQHGLTPTPGLIVDPRGKVLGRHSGITGYTVGQRRGLGVCGSEPYYVIRIDASAHSVVIGTREESLCRGLRMSHTNILAPYPPVRGERFQVKVRSTGKPVSCTITAVWPDAMEIEFHEPQSGVAPGQAAVLYCHHTVIGGGWIEATLSRSGHQAACSGFDCGAHPAV